MKTGLTIEIAHLPEGFRLMEANCPSYTALYASRAEAEAAAERGEQACEPHRWRVREESGADKIFEADSAEEALEEAKEWVAGGEYDRPVSVVGWVVEIDKSGEPIGEEESFQVHAGQNPDPPKTDCGASDECHDWQSPAWLGGCSENPGVWSHGAHQTRVEVCGSCGLYRHTVTDIRAEGDPEQITYESANERSLAALTEAA